MSVRPIPEGYHSVTPYLVATGVDRLLEFVKEAFGATELHRSSRPDGTIMHAEIQIGDSRIMMGEAKEGFPPIHAALYLYVPDTDAVYKQAVAAGGTSIMEPADQFYGDRNAGVKDLSGNQWWIGTHIEDVEPEELKRRAEAAMQHQR